MLIGMDILDIKKIENIASKEGVLCRLFTPAELGSVINLNYRKKIKSLASIYAGKEATVKALGTGFTDDIGILDIQILIENDRKVEIDFLAEAKNLADKLGVSKSHLALSATKELVIAIVVLEN